MLDPDNQQLADSRRHHQAARIRHARAWIESDILPAPPPPPKPPIKEKSK